MLFATDRYITEWAKDTVTAIPDDTKSMDMNECSFNDLKVRLGCPYVFLHQGQCEHLVVFKDIRWARVILCIIQCKSRQLILSKSFVRLLIKDVFYCFFIFIWPVPYCASVISAIVVVNE